MNRNLERAAEWVEQADALIIAAGAGMGVDSGLPDFRGNDGFWRAYPALAAAGLEFTAIACPDAFRDNPAMAWGFYGHRLALYRATPPHPGFALLKHWAGRMKDGYSVFTSNVDGQFQKAGYDDHAVNECHGSIHYLQCLDSCSDDTWPADAFVPDVDERRCLLRNAPPRCPSCGRLARPNILMFGDGDWSSSRQFVQESRQRAWLAKVVKPVVIELGAGTAIPSVRHFSRQMCVEQGARLVRINPRESGVNDDGGVGLPMGALQGLQGIADILGDRWRLPVAAS